MSHDDSSPHLSSSLDDEAVALLRRERDDALRELRRTTESRSYRATRMVSWFPRRLKALVTRRSNRNDARARPGHEGSGAGSDERPLPLTAAPAADRPQRVAQPDVSVVIPVFNAEDWVSECIASVLAQTGADLEVICVDDGSTDGSGAVLRRFAAADERVTVIDQPNQGQSVARNAGLDAASGRYIVYLDSDDFWMSDSLSGFVRRADEAKLDVLLFDCVAFRDGDVTEAIWARYGNYYKRKNEYDTVRTGLEMIDDMRSHRDYRPHVGMYLARTEYVRRAGARFIPGIVHQDNPYTFALLLNAPRTAHVKEDAYARRVRPGSTITALRAEQSAKGYYLSYVAMSRMLAAHGDTAPTPDGVYSVVAGVFDGGRKAAATLTPDARRALRALDDSVDAQLILRAMVGDA
ncbi:glycosyltransferase family 2 protein [Microbacterium lacticum]